jgi:hypothetical protein
MMADAREVGKLVITIRLDPFYSPDATDVYANVAAVGQTPQEVVIAFGQIFPDQVPPGQSEVTLAPRLRVTMPVVAARKLVQVLAEQLRLRDELEAKSTE